MQVFQALTDSNLRPPPYHPVDDRGDEGVDDGGRRECDDQADKQVLDPAGQLLLLGLCRAEACAADHPDVGEPSQVFPIYENIAKIPIQEGGGDGRSDDQR